MPRKLTFTIKRRTFDTTPVKVDRGKLYGRMKIEATDDRGAPCRIVSTDETGRFIIPPGGMAVGLLSVRGEWVERDELKTVAADGSAARLLPSSYDTEILLREKATPREYLNHDITDFYELADAPEELIRLVGGEIYTFAYCYSRECEGTPAFVMESGGALFLLLGRRIRFEMTGFDEPEFIDDDSDGDDAFAGDIDFTMF